MIARLTHRARRQLAALGIGFLLYTPLAAASEHLLTLGVFSYRPLPIMQARFQPLVEHLNAQLDKVHLELRILTQKQIETAIANDELDLLFTNPSHYIYLRYHYDLQGALVTLVNREQDIPVSELGGVILAARSAGIETLADLKGRKIAIPGKRFLGGFQTQAYELLAEENLHIPEDIQVQEMGSHDAVMQSLLTGENQIGFVRTGILEQFFTSREQLPDHLEVINPLDYEGFPFVTSTRLYPEWPLVTVKPCPCERDLLRALINLAPNQPAVQQLGIDGFAPPADYSLLERLAQALHLPPYDQDPLMSLQTLVKKYAGPLLLIAFLLVMVFLFAISQYRSKKQLGKTLQQLKEQEKETHQIQQLLEQQTEQLQASNKELEQFAYVASHDLRQPLRMISSYLQMLDRQLGEQLNEEQRRMLNFAVDGAKRQNEMLVALLEYSRVGRLGEPMHWVASYNAIEEALRFLHPEIKKSQAVITLMDTDWPQVYASRNELTRLFQNLLGNALKYRDPKEPPKIHVSVQDSDKEWIFVVQDEGIGINPDQFDRLFKVFQRLHTSNQYEGTGVGLAVCHKMVTRHGGRIWVESEGEGQGSRFIFTLPKSVPAEADPAQPLAETAQG